MSEKLPTEAIDLDRATPDQIDRANAAVQANLNEDGSPKFDSAQGYACALTAIMQSARPTDAVERVALVDLLDPLLRYHETGGHEGHCSEKRVALLRAEVTRLQLAALTDATKDAAHD